MQSNSKATVSLIRVGGYSATDLDLPGGEAASRLAVCIQRTTPLNGKYLTNSTVIGYTDRFANGLDSINDSYKFYLTRAMTATMQRGEEGKDVAYWDCQLNQHGYLETRDPVVQHLSQTTGLPFTDYVTFDELSRVLDEPDYRFYLHAGHTHDGTIPAHDGSPEAIMSHQLLAIISKRMGELSIGIVKLLTDGEHVVIEHMDDLLQAEAFTYALMNDFRDLTMARMIARPEMAFDINLITEAKVKVRINKGTLRDFAIPMFDYRPPVLM